MFFSCWGFRIFPLVPAFLAVAALKDRRFPRPTGVLWLLLSGALCVYVVTLEVGPQPDTLRGLTIQAVAQKLVALILVLSVAYQSHQAARIAPRPSAQISASDRGA